jgi:trimeric autotransporter adhesin
MAMSGSREREAKKFLKSGTIGSFGLVFLLGISVTRAAPPNPTPSDEVYNTAGGTGSLFSVTSGGVYNTAFGYRTLFNTTEGLSNTAIGFSALEMNTESSNNTAAGYSALRANTGVGSTAVGAFALEMNTEGSSNTALGYGALSSNDTGNGNTAIGSFANVSPGDLENVTVIGAGALGTSSNSILLGNERIRAIFAHVSNITGISDRRRKKDIKALDPALGLGFITKLKPVSYRFSNGDETERYGFIAQDLEQALPASLHDTIERSEPEHGLALIERQNDNGRTYRVSYGELLAPIVKAIQEQQEAIAAERQQNADLRQALAAISDQVAALKAQNNALRDSIANFKEQVIVAR